MTGGNLISVLLYGTDCFINGGGNTGYVYDAYTDAPNADGNICQRGFLGNEKGLEATSPPGLLCLLIPIKQHASFRTDVPMTVSIH